MKKLLLKSAIVALVSTGFSGVMAVTTNPSSTSNQTDLHLSITLKGHKSAILTASSSQPFNLDLPLLNSVNASNFPISSSSKPAQVLLNSLYDTSKLRNAFGCIQISNLDKNLKGSGVTKIDLGTHLILGGIALKNASQSVPISNMKISFANGQCQTSLPSNLTNVRLSSNTLGLADTELDPKNNPTTTDLAVYYQLQATALDNILLDLNHIFLNTDAEPFSGQLAFTISF